MAEVRLENVCKHFDEVVAVNDFSLSIADKEFVVLVGPSGCGKTTALRMIAGLEDVTSGSLFIGDRLVTNVPAKDRNIAMVFQNYALYPHMTVYENMAFSLEMHKTAKSEVKRRVHDAAEILGIRELLNRKPKQLSGGQRQRVAVGRAIVRKPEVFLFDEPLSNLDAKLRAQTRVELKKLHERIATTAVYVTHDQVEAMTMGDRIVVMRDGIIQQVGNPLELYEAPANKFVGGFLGSPTMNFFEAELSRSNDSLSLTTPSFNIKLPPAKSARIKNYNSKKVIVGIRPEDLVPVGDGIANNAINLQVDVVEPIGSETYVFGNAGDVSIVAGVGRGSRIKAHQQVVLTPMVDSIHLFDINSEKTLL